MNKGTYMLFEKYNEKVFNYLLPVELIRPYPSIDKREEWNRIGKNELTVIKGQSKEYKDFPIRPLKASILVDCIESGNNDEVKLLFKEKMNALISVTLAECAFYNGEYLDKVLDIAWSLMDMAIWYLPTPKIVANGKLNTNKNETDLISTQICEVLTYTYYLLKTKFDEIDINIGKRFKYEIQKRILKPYLQESKSWMKNEYGHYLPWVPECISNIIFAYMIFETDYKIRHKIIKDSLIIIDEIIKDVTKENLVDRDTTYNGLISYFDLLYMITGSAFNAFSDFNIDNLIKLAISSEEHDTGTCISLLQHIFYTDNTELVAKAYSQKAKSFPFKYSKENISISQTLFTIFNSDLIENKFYLKKKGI